MNDPVEGDLKGKPVSSSKARENETSVDGRHYKFWIVCNAISPPSITQMENRDSRLVLTSSFSTGTEPGSSSLNTGQTSLCYEALHKHLL